MKFGNSLARIPALMAMSLAILTACSIKSHELSWFSGCWLTESGQTSEHWSTDPQTGNLLGIGRVMSKPAPSVAPKILFTETLTIQKEGDDFVYIAAPGTAAPTRFTEVSRTVSPELKTVTFENPDHDYPQRIRYERSRSLDTPVLTAIISKIDGTKEKRWAFSKQCDAEAR